MSNTPSQFSRLFLNNHTGYRSSELLRTNVKFPEHPFYKIDSYISSEVENDIFWDFERDFNSFLKMKEDINSSYSQFQFEYSLLLMNRDRYLNEVVGVLLKYLDIIEDTLLDGTVGASPNETRQCLIIIIKGILKDLFVQYHRELNNSHYITLSKWFHLRKPIKSFQWNTKHHPDNSRLWNLYNTYLVKPGFIDISSYQSFKALFGNKILEDRVNWRGSKSSLYLFIRLLLKHKVIRNPKNRHWVVASEYILLDGETFTPEELRSQKETQNKEQRKALEYFVSHLIS